MWVQGSLHPEAGCLFLSTKEPSTDQVMHPMGSFIFPERVTFPNLHKGTLEMDVALLAWHHAVGVAPIGLRSSATSRWRSGHWPHSGLGRWGAGEGIGEGYPGPCRAALPLRPTTSPRLPLGSRAQGARGIGAWIPQYNWGFAVSWGSAEEGVQGSPHYDPAAVLPFHSITPPSIFSCLCGNPRLLSLPSGFSPHLQSS